MYIKNDFGNPQISHMRRNTIDCGKKSYRILKIANGYLYHLYEMGLNSVKTDFLLILYFDTLIHQSITHKIKNNSFFNQSFNK